MSIMHKMDKENMLIHLICFSNDLYYTVYIVVVETTATLSALYIRPLSTLDTPTFLIKQRLQLTNNERLSIDLFKS